VSVHMTTPEETRAGTEAIEQFVAGLQAGLDASDADLYDRQFADDLLWGSPYGMTLRGFEPLNGVHRLLMPARAALRSRYEIVQVLVPVPGTVIAHVRRQPVAPGGAGDFPEMAMYVLVERAGRWELVGGQNTPVTASPS
jgi:uncharacterized protein (TIGR02246 family)